VLARDTSLWTDDVWVVDGHDRCHCRWLDRRGGGGDVSNAD
jgi:hypothetical protein